MIISLISCIDLYYGIGKDNKLLCKIPEDLKRFKQKTLHHPIVMGETTFYSIGKPLPNRDNIILSNNEELKIPGTTIVNSFRQLYKHCRENYDYNVEVFICGGASIYKQTYPTCDYIYLTIIHNTFSADTFFPKIDYSKFDIINNEFHKRDKNSFRFLDLKNKMF